MPFIISFASASASAPAHFHTERFIIGRSACVQVTYFESGDRLSAYASTFSSSYSYLSLFLPPLCGPLLDSLLLCTNMTTEPTHLTHLAQRARARRNHRWQIADAFVIPYLFEIFIYFIFIGPVVAVSFFAEFLSSQQSAATDQPIQAAALVTKS